MKLHIFVYKGNSDQNYVRNRQIAVITIVSIAVLVSFSIVYSNFEDIVAYAADILSNDNVAKTLQVRINPVGTNIENTFYSFSRIGFVDGEANFLLESVPSKDKKPFYLLVQKSLEAKKAPLLKNQGMNIAIDVFSGDGEIIETLLYNDCDVVEYFVHGVDSKGKIFFTEEDGTVEIREVTKFECVSFGLDIKITEEDINQVKETISIIDRNQFELPDEEGYFSAAPKDAKDGDLFFNSITNTLQRNFNGTWVDISGVGGPPTPRR